MRRITLWLLSTISVVVLLFSYHTSTDSVSASARAGSTVRTGSTTPGSSTTAGAGGSSSGSSSNGTVTGTAVDTRYGPVQVQITVKAGKLTAATAVEYPQTTGRDQEINSYAIPQLNQETVTAGNASIDMVSGATFTSQGYISSLQSALDKAGL